MRKIFFTVNLQPGLNGTHFLLLLTLYFAPKLVQKIAGMENGKAAQILLFKIQKPEKISLRFIYFYDDYQKLFLRWSFFIFCKKEFDDDWQSCDKNNNQNNDFQFFLQINPELVHK